MTNIVQRSFPYNFRKYQIEKLRKHCSDSKNNPLLWFIILLILVQII